MTTGKFDFVESRTIELGPADARSTRQSNRIVAGDTFCAGEKVFVRVYLKTKTELKEALGAVIVTSRNDAK